MQDKIFTMFTGLARCNHKDWWRRISRASSRAREIQTWFA